jgi:glycosyltransferase involved in cell wall biosynthesis
VRIAFYAPLKPPAHPVPSGDRRIGELFLNALRCAGHAPFLVSRFRTYEGTGDPLRQARLEAVAERLGRRLLRRFREQPQEAPDLWFTYHLYHKAPDYFGPLLADALAIPYVVAEASFAPNRAQGPWAIGHRAAFRAIRRADLVIALNPADSACVLPLLAAPARLLALKPFLDLDRVCRRRESDGARPHLIVAAMMRNGDKLASYRLLGEALSEVLDLPWSLQVIGGGNARKEVERALAPLAPRVEWSGILGPAAIADRLAAADLYVWPAINEAFGMALLEAAAAGLPIVAGDFGGVRAIVSSGATCLVVPPGDGKAFASAVRTLLLDRERRERMGEAARVRACAKHGLGTAARRLAEALRTLPKAKAAQTPGFDPLRDAIL